MCVIVMGYSNTAFDRVELDRIADSYPDGLGLVSSALSSPLKILPNHNREYTEPQLQQMMRAIQGHSFMLHGRQATHGTLSNANTHPFYIGDGWYMAHNGMLYDAVYQHKTLSDSNLLANKLQPLPFDQKIVLLTSLMTTNNRFGLWHPTHGAIPLGLRLQEDGCLYSNTYHRLGMSDVGGRGYEHLTDLNKG